MRSRSYIEAVDILYSNTFYITSAALLRDFPELVPPRSLACMKGLILNLAGLEFFLNHEVDRETDNVSGIGALEIITSTLGSGVFQNLRELDVNIIDSTVVRSTSSEKAENQAQRILAIFDELMPKMGSRFQRLQICLGDTLYEIAKRMTERSKRDLVNERMEFTKPKISVKHKFWHPVLDFSRVGRSLGYWIAQDNWQSQCFDSVTKSSPGSVSQGLRRLIKF